VAEQIDIDLDRRSRWDVVTYVFNHSGHTMLAGAVIEKKAYKRFFAHVHNMDARGRLLRLQLDIYQKKLTPEKIGSYLEQSPNELLDCYRNKPFRWDVAKRELWFEGVDTKLKKDDTSKVKANQRVGIRI
jgi:hypothetical protein